MNTPITNHIKERIKIFKQEVRWLNNWIIPNCGSEETNFLLVRIDCLQAVLSKIEEIEKEERIQSIWEARAEDKF